tara:strand:+ start:290386 stop:290820 length:435 start_codon:yes stop_codon:yes gene_type:complete
MITALRFVAAVVVAVGVGLVLLILIELFSAVVHPFPEDFGGTAEEMCEHVARYPSWVLAVVVPIWGFSAWLSTWIAKCIGHRWAAVVVGVLWIVAVLFNVTQLPYPIWFKCLATTAIVIAVASAIGLLFKARSSAQRNFGSGNC